MTISVSPEIETFIPGLAFATGIGLLVGAERGWRMRNEEPGSRVAGVRTFAILGLLGGLLGPAAAMGMESAALLVAAGAIAMLLVGYYTEMRTEARLSATSAIAAVTTIFLGALAASGHMALASVSAGIMVALLASREALHHALERTSQAEMTALVRLALVVFLVLPLLPDADIGPFGGINPRRIWFVVVAVGSISLFGYALARWQGGRRGTLLMALVGAMVSSTAVTIEAARRIREKDGGPAESTAVSLASFIMLARVVLLTTVIAPQVAGDLLLLILPPLAVSFAFMAIPLWQTINHHQEDGHSVNPPTLTLAFLFAALVALLSFGVRWAEATLSAGSGVLVIALGGMIDVDSAVAAVGALPAGSLTPKLAAIAIASSVAVNTLVKLGLVVSIAGLRRAAMANACLLLTAAAIAVGALARWP